MPLTTFGAIMGFAADMSGRTGEIYGNLAGKAKDVNLKAILQTLSAEEGKNHALMVKTRRENVTEMILEPVAGLHREEYQVDPKVRDEMGDADVLKSVILLEERGKKFFRDASSKVPLPEVARIFRKISQKKEENLAKLQSLGLTQPGQRRT